MGMMPGAAPPGPPAGELTARIHHDGAEWRWDVEIIGLRSTGGRQALGEALDDMIADIRQFARYLPGAPSGEDAGLPPPPR